MTLKSLVWRSRLCWNVEKVIRDESSTLRSCHRSEMNLLYQAECSSTHFWGSDLEILGLEVTTMLKCRKSYQTPRRILYPQIMSPVVTLKSLVWRSRLCWNVEKVIRDESSTLRSCHRSEMNLLYQAECSSTHFWGSDLEILGLEVTTMLK